MLDKLRQNSSSRLGQKLWFLVKLSVSLVLVVYLLSIVDWEQALHTISQANKLLLAIGPLFWLASLVMGAARWQVVLAGNGVDFSIRQAYSGYLLGSFYNIFLPGVVGGDAVRVGLCVSETRCEVGTATASVLLERVSGVAALLSFFFFVSLFYPEIATSLLAIESTEPLMLLLILVFLLGMVVAVGYRIWWDRRGIRGTGRVWAFLQSASQTFQGVRGKTLGSMLLLSILFQAIRILGMFVLSKAIGLSLPLRAFFAVVPLVYLATLLPISLGGLGVREGALVFLLARLGVPTSSAITLSFLIYLNQVFLGMLGGSLQLARLLSSRRRVEPAESVDTVRLSNH